MSVAVSYFRGSTPCRPDDAHRIQFQAPLCDACDQHAACTVSPLGRGRSIELHPHEALLQTLRSAMRAPEGRAVLRQRAGIEHSLARGGRIQRSKARYKGIRKNKNTLDVRGCATVANLESVSRLKAAS